MNKIHYIGTPCGTKNKRWASSVLSSTSNKDKVTCLKCKQALLKL